MKGAILLVCIVYLLLVSNVDVDAKDDSLLRLPGATLLFGNPDGAWYITADSVKIDLQPNPSASGQNCFSSVSRDGKTVATRYRKESALAESSVAFAVATYSLLDKKWTEYTQNHEVDAVSISADGSKLAVIGADDDHGRHSLKVLDRETRHARLVAGPISAQAAPSWSPDGDRVAYQIGDFLSTKRDSAIYVIEIKTGRASKVADGENPSWSPSGEWIAYLSTPVAAEPIKCMAVRPDGTNTITLVAAPSLTRTWLLLSGRGPLPGRFVWAPVWSPDSTKLLLNEVADGDNWGMNIDLLDVASHKLTRKSKNGVPILGWARDDR
jgi:Tol biopolymer transport system component